MQGTKFIEKYFFIGLLIVSILLVFIILFPFISIIAIGIAISVSIYPIYKQISKLFRNKLNWLASLITITILLALIWVPLLVLGNVAYDQFINLYKTFSITDSDPVIQTFNNMINHYMPSGFVFDLQAEAAKFISTIFANITNLFTTTLHTIFLFILAILAIFYTLKDGNDWRNMFVKLSPLATNHNEKILDTLSNAINGIIRGYILIALAQGILMGIGLAIFGVPHPVLWGVAAGILSLVPTIGTSIVSIPAIVYLLIMGMNTNALGMTIWAVAIVGMVDNLLNPLIVGKNTNLHPMIILFAVLGGISIFGPMGILIGPLAFSLLKALFNIYREEVKE